MAQEEIKNESMKIENVLHLYIGQKIEWFPLEYGIIKGVSKNSLLIEFMTATKYISPDECRLILRRLSDMSEDEWIELGKIHVKNGGKIKITMGHGPAHPGIKYYPDVFLYLLSKGFWLWNDSAFDEGLIIDAKTVTV